MIRLFKEDPDEFMRHCHSRSTVESAFNALKAKYGSSLRRTSRISQRRELGLKAVCCSISTVNKLRVASRLGLY